jgi:hypothetical protein
VSVKRTARPYFRLCRTTPKTSAETIPRSRGEFNQSAPCGWMARLLPTPPCGEGGAPGPAHRHEAFQPSCLRVWGLPITQAVSLLLFILSTLAPAAAAADPSMPVASRVPASSGPTAAMLQAQISQGSLLHAGGVEARPVEQLSGVMPRHARPVVCLRGGSAAAGASAARPAVGILGGRFAQLDELLERNREALLKEHGGEEGVRPRRAARVARGAGGLTRAGRGRWLR